VLKYLEIEFGTHWEKNTTIIKGEINEHRLQEKLDSFIDKYVLCPKCTYPEMQLRVRKGVVCGKCDSCGHRADLDNKHNFASYIVKNHPKSKGIKENYKEREELGKT